MRPHIKAEHRAAPDQSVKTPRALLPHRRRPQTALYAFFGSRVKPCVQGAL